MNSRPRAPRSAREPLSRERVISAAVALADESGASGVTMRAVGRRLGVEAMSLYNHVANREQILDGMIDRVFAEIDLPRAASDWKQPMRERAHAVRTVLRHHPWAVGLMGSRSTPGPATLRHHDAVLGTLRTAGFSVALAAHAFSVIDSYLYGFVLQEQSLPFTGHADIEDVAGAILIDLTPETHPYLTELITSHALRPDYNYADEFEYGLALILDALQPDEDPEARPTVVRGREG